MSALPSVVDSILSFCLLLFQLTRIPGLKLSAVGNAVLYHLYHWSWREESTRTHKNAKQRKRKQATVPFSPILNYQEMRIMPSKECYAKGGVVCVYRLLSMVRAHQQSGGSHHLLIRPEHLQRQVYHYTERCQQTRQTTNSQKPASTIGHCLIHMLDAAWALYRNEFQDDLVSNCEHVEHTKVKIKANNHLWVWRQQTVLFVWALQACFYTGSSAGSPEHAFCQLVHIVFDLMQVHSKHIKLLLPCEQQQSSRSLFQHEQT